MNKDIGVIHKNLLKMSDIVMKLDILSVFLNNAILVALGKLDDKDRFNMKIVEQAPELDEKSAQMIANHEAVLDSHVTGIHLLTEFNILIKAIQIFDTEEDYKEDLLGLVDSVMPITKKLEKVSKYVKKEGAD